MGKIREYNYRKMNYTRLWFWQPAVISYRFRPYGFVSLPFDRFTFSVSTINLIDFLSEYLYSKYKNTLQHALGSRFMVHSDQNLNGNRLSYCLKKQIRPLALRPCFSTSLLTIIFVNINIYYFREKCNSFFKNF